MEEERARQGLSGSQEKAVSENPSTSGPVATTTEDEMLAQALAMSMQEVNILSEL